MAGEKIKQANGLEAKGVPAEERGGLRKVLVIDPSVPLIQFILGNLQEEYDVLHGATREEALRVLEREGGDLILIGVDLPFIYYDPFIRSLRRARPQVPILFLLGESAALDAPPDLPLSDWLKKPINGEALREKVRGLIIQRELAGADGEPVKPPGEAEEGKGRFSSSRVPADLRAKIEKIGGTLFPVFIQGEEGSGRSEIARRIHLLGPWQGGSFCRICCRGVSVEDFWERVLSCRRRMGPGKRKTTLFLEGVEDLNRELQGELLDMIAGQAGGRNSEWRLLTASQYSLGKLVAAGRMRNDLAELLGTIEVVLKPLRERSGEIPGLVEEILKDAGLQRGFSPEALALLQRYYWPGNLREMEGVVLRSALLKEEGPLKPEDLAFRVGNPAEDKRGEAQEAAAVFAEEAEPFLDGLLATLAHEIKNPMVTISTFAHLLPEKYEDPEFREEFSRLVGVDIQRINGLLEMLLEYGRLPAPQVEGQDLHAVLLKVLEEKGKDLRRNGVQVMTRLEENLPPVLADHAQLEFVLRKTVENMVVGIGRGKTVRLSTGVTEGEPKGVDLLFWHDGQDERLNERSGAGSKEGTLEIEKLSMLLTRKILKQNGAVMESYRGSGAEANIRIHFSIGEK